MGPGEEIFSLFDQSSEYYPM